MDEYTKLLKNYTATAIIILLLLGLICGSFIAGFKVDSNITGEEKPKISYRKSSEYVNKSL